MIDWFSTKEIAAITKTSVQAVHGMAKREGWEYRPRTGRGGGKEYSLESLPAETQAVLLRNSAEMSAIDDLRVRDRVVINGRRGEFCGFIGSPVVGLRVKWDGGDHPVNVYLKDLGSVCKDVDEAEPVALVTLQAESPTVGERLERISVPDTDPKSNDERKIFAKLAVLRAFEAFCADTERVVACEYEFCQAYANGEITVDPWVRKVLPKLSRSTLARCKKTVKSGEFTALAGDYKGNTTGTIIDSQPLLREFVLGCIAKNPVKINARFMFQGMHQRFPGWELPSLPTLRRWIDRWVAENQQSFALLKNPDDWKNRYMPAFGSYSDGIERANQLWELDSTPADLALVVGRRSDGSPQLRRHHLVGCIDVFSRRGKLLLTPTSRAAAIAALIRACILDWGVPEAVKTDNGSDYKSIYIDQVFSSLGVVQNFCQPYSPEQKPHIERFLGSFSHGLAAQLPGYLGHDVATRKAIEAQRSFADRLNRPELLDIPLPAEQFQAFVTAWCRDFYGNQPHQGLGGKTPNDVAFSSAQANPPRRVADERVLDLLLAEGKNVTVQKKGIRVDGRHFVAPELGGRVRDRVHIRFTGDAGRIAVFADQRCQQFICIAENPELTGLNRQEVARAAKAMAGAQRQAVRDLKAAAKSQGIEELPQELIDAARENAAATHPALRALLQGGELTGSGGAGSFAELPAAALEAVGWLAGMDAPAEARPLTSEVAQNWAQIEAAEAEAARIALVETPEAKYYRVWKAVEQGFGPATAAERQWLKDVRTTSTGRALEAHAEMLWTLDDPSAEAG